MVSLEHEHEPVQGNLRSSDAPTSPRISFSAEFLDDNNFISICPNPLYSERDQEKEQHEKTKNITDQFEFLSNNNMSNNNTVLSADELFFDGKILPFWQMQHLEKLNKINIKEEQHEEVEEVIEVVVNSNKEDNSNNNSRVNWFVDDDPSPRPPKCTVLWKELLRLKKQRASSLSPSSSSSSSSSNASSLGDVAAKEGSRNKENQHVKRIKKGLERTRSATIRIRPMINVPICTQMKNSSLPPLFPLKKGKILER
ncbi:hypothetical protein L195_g013420 [Trifolium pratense]|uniref:Uncharacterized protein n=2 Tax=Trifolium pratense TaxID=57577 RepID=A0A2K3PN33_TRIPR|nr:uncharacterized protein LOC123882979 [Trifolium pratense]PNX95879.1 hypothetical protein L195_g019076 [Trifolium pratense]PNY16534.1 hypothetical protein L195_g013256 [Trifolium pratense]PNY16695.1 hypothetical protein L195_g013420 [Trifolium pratense]CAJ2630276.1 unnamed protein product [Trifolium pratense]